MSLSRRDLLAGAAAVSAQTFPFGQALAQTSPDAAFRTTCNALADALLKDNPENATFLGLDKGARAGLKSRLSDQSWSHIAKDRDVCAAWLGKLDAIPQAQLSPAAQTDKAVVSYALTLGRDGGRFEFGANTLASAMNENATPYIVSQETGSFVSVPEFLDSQHKIETKADADAYLARMEAMAAVLDQETKRVKRDVGLGVLLPNFLLTTALGQMEAFLKMPAADQRMVSSLTSRAKKQGIAGDYAGPAAKLVSDKIYPALGRQIATLKAVGAKATPDAGVWKFKDGEAYYSWLLKVGTTTSMTAKQIHALGLAQNAEISARMDMLLKKQGLSKGTVGERMTALGRDPRFLYPDNDIGRAQIIEYLRGRIAAVRQRLPELFNLKLKAPVIIKRVPPDIQDGAPLGYMNPGAIDGSRPSTYYINLKTTTNWPRFSLPTLTYHETIPGHAWQGAYVTETGKLPLIRIILSGFNAYVEGWALYAEQLAGEMGLYAGDPVGELGYLQAQQFRACRLVADTGLHAMRWTREQTIDWFVANTGRPRASMQSEVDRYCGTPGQACGYKIGHTEINRLRDKARTALGSKFDLRDFNDALVTAGAVPLPVLADLIDRHVAMLKRGA
ncbi:MAG: DUF885 domain-containing protein [Alphaproteobacteria bacterium]|nr:DUF885 domain-containing protein [Alphaproteobacteria bacterium]